MITSELCDPLNKQLKIEPVVVDFGTVSEGKNYQMFFKIRNDDNVTNRVQIRKAQVSDKIKIENFIGGKVVPGESKKIKVVLDTTDLYGKFSDLVEVQTKSFVYKIPVKAAVVRKEEFDKNKQMYNVEGRDFYKKSYPSGDSKNKCDPIKLVLPKIKEIEDNEKMLMIKKKKEKAELEDADDSGDYDGKLPQV